MQEQIQSSENNTQEQQVVNIPKRRGRPPKDLVPTRGQITSQLEVIPASNSTEISTQNNEELILLKSQLQQLQEQNEKLLKIAETVAITNTKNLIECSDAEINSLYVDYITKHETTHDNAIVVEVENKVIIPKSYYVVS
jgi:hypothetical protein